MNEQALKRFQIWLGISVGIISFAVAAHNFKNIYLSKKAPERTTVETNPSPVREAIEEVGASWIKKIGFPKNKTDQNTMPP